MFTPIRLMRLGYVVGLAALVIVLSVPSSSKGQVPASRTPIAPLLGTVNSFIQPSIQQTQAMLQLAGVGGGFGGGPLAPNGDRGP